MSRIGNTYAMRGIKQPLIRLAQRPKRCSCHGKLKLTSESYAPLNHGSNHRRWSNTYRCLRCGNRYQYQWEESR